MNTAALGRLGWIRGLTLLAIISAAPFQWEMAGGRDDMFAPFLTREPASAANPLSGAKPVPSTLTEEAMPDLWERIAGSIRLRPTTPITR